MSICKRNCCWTPYDVCSRKQECSCHTNDQPVYKKLTLEELARAQSISEAKAIGRRR